MPMDHHWYTRRRPRAMAGMARASGSILSDSTQAPGRTGASQASHATPSATMRTQPVVARRRGEGIKARPGGGVRRDRSRKVSYAAMAAPSPVQTFTRRLGTLLARMARQVRELHLQNTAASLAFLSLLAIVPIFSIVLSVLAALPVFDSFREALQGFFARHLFPSTISQTVLEYVNGFAAQASR